MNGNSIVYSSGKVNSDCNVQVSSALLQVMTIYNKPFCNVNWICNNVVGSCFVYDNCTVLKR